MKTNFITEHIIELIINEVEGKKKIGGTATSFFYFEEPIIDGDKHINRVSQFNPFEKEEILPIGWHVLEGSTLLEIYDKLKNNEFFFYKLIDGKSYKARLKKNVKVSK